MIIMNYKDNKQASLQANKYKDIGRYGSTVAGNRKIVPHFIKVSLNFGFHCWYIAFY